MAEAERAKILDGETFIGAFDFLQAENVGVIFSDKTLDMLQADANRIDVPGCEGEFHRVLLYLAPAACNTQKDAQPLGGLGVKPANVRCSRRESGQSE